MAINISNSRAKTFRQCHRKYHYKYIEKIQKKIPAKPLLRGRIIHELIEAWYNEESWNEVLAEYLKEYDKLFEEEQQEYGDLPTELPKIMKGYVAEYKDSGLEPVEYKGSMAEHEFEVPLIPRFNINFTGYIDRIMKDDDGRIWLTETKSHKKIPDEERRFSDMQTTLYSWAMPRMGLPEADGVLWDYIRTKTPTKPRVLKNGGLTKRKNIDTTKQVYLETLEENDLDPEDYQEILDMLENKRTDFYRRIFLPSPDSMVDTLIEELRQTALEIFMVGDELKDRNLTRKCTWGCDYYNLCQAELKGLDSDYIRKTEYERRSRDDEEEKEQSD